MQDYISCYGRTKTRTRTRMSSGATNSARVSRGECYRLPTRYWHVLLSRSEADWIQRHWTQIAPSEARNTLFLVDQIIDHARQIKNFKLPERIITQWNCWKFTQMRRPPAKEIAENRSPDVQLNKMAWVDYVRTQCFTGRW